MTEVLTLLVSNGMKLSEELQVRGFVHQFSADTLEEILDGPKRTVYHGIDPTADSAHAGNFVNWILLRHLVNDGHKVIFLVGGGTGRIGDPKPDAERELTDPSVIDERVEKLKQQAIKLLGTAEIEFVNNNDWLSSLGLIDFLRDIGKHFTVNDLIKKDAIATRLASEVGLSYTEFAYPLLQAYDYLELNRRYGCDFQVGGSDQWGNIIAGVDLVRRLEQKTVYALTQPLIVDKATGKKFGKSEGNAVWLDADKTSPFAFYQFWLNASDESVIEHLKRFTFIPLAEIADIEHIHQADPGKRVAQKRLAFEVTSFVHGVALAESTERVSGILFSGDSLSSLSDTETEMIKQNAPTFLTTVGAELIEVLVQSGLASSKREARTFIESGAVELGGQKVETIDRLLAETDLIGSMAILKRGKKQLCVLLVA